MENRSTGILGSLGRIGDALLATVRNRMELFTVELQEEKWHLVEVLILSLLAVGAVFFALGLLTFLIILLFWNDGRIPAVAALAGVYLVGAILLGRMVRLKLSRWAAFSTTLEQLRKDRTCIASWRDSTNESER